MQIIIDSGLETRLVSRNGAGSTAGASVRCEELSPLEFQTLLKPEPDWAFIAAEYARGLNGGPSQVEANSIETAFTIHTASIVVQTDSAGYSKFHNEYFRIIVPIAWRNSWETR